jgi:hypothetical protein
MRLKGKRLRQAQRGMSEKTETFKVIVVISAGISIQIRPVIKILSFDEIDRNPGPELSLKHVGPKVLFTKGNFKFFEDRPNIIVPFPDDPVIRKEESHIEPEAL